MKDIIKRHIDEHQVVLNNLCNLSPIIEEIALLMINALKNGNTIFWCGNGGSASDAQHLAGELIGRFVGNRKPLKSISLLSGGAEGSCIANDFGYDHVFSRQIEGLGVKDDVLIGISTSGNSQNVLNAFNQARNNGLKTIGLLGKGGGEALSSTDKSVVIDSFSTARIQEMHIIIGHILCDLIEVGLSLKNNNEKI